MPLVMIRDLPMLRGFEFCLFYGIYDGAKWRVFQFSDAVNGVKCNMMMFWFAKRLNDLSLLWLENQHLKIHLLNLLKSVYCHV